MITYNTERIRESRTMAEHRQITYCISLFKNYFLLSGDTAESGRSSMKKIQKTFYKIMPFLVMPGLIMSAIFPFFLPGLKMMTLMVGMMNNMALTGAIFTILRNNAFNDRYEHKVIYVNDGYENEKYAASNTEEHIHTNHFGGLYDDTKEHIKQEDHAFGEDFNHVEEVPTLSVNPEWLKAYTAGNMLAIVGKDHHHGKH